MIKKASLGSAGYVLSIVIPTYNRAELLQFLIKSIIYDFNFWPEDLELVIIDNASTDHTREMVERYIFEGVPIRLVVNKCNIGMDGNLAACFNISEAKYLWQIGDDEVLYQGCAKYVLNFCRTKDFGLLHIESVGFLKGEQAGQLVHKIPEKINPRLLNSTQIIRRANVFLTFISANIVNRHLLMSEEPKFNSEEEINTYLPQLAWIYGVLRLSNRHFYINSPLFGALVGNTGGYRLIEVFGVNLLEITNRRLCSFFPEARSIMANSVLTRLLPGELMAIGQKSASCNDFEDECLGLSLEKAFGHSFILHFTSKGLLSPSRMSRRLIFFGVRLFNIINRKLGYLFL